MARTRNVWFYVGDYEEQLRELLAEAVAAEKRPQTPLRTGEKPLYDVLRDRYQALKEEALSSADKAVVRELSFGEKRELKKTHPPRVEGADDETRRIDASYGLNVETVYEDLIHKCLVEPTFSTRAAFDEWLEERGAGQADALFSECLALIGRSPDPKSLPDLPTLSSGEK